MTETAGKELTQRFYLLGQHVGLLIRNAKTDGQTVLGTLAAKIYGDRNPETTILQAQLFLGNRERHHELIEVALDGSRNPLDTSARLYLDQLSDSELRSWETFVGDHGENGFAAEAARDHILKNLESGAFASRAEYAKFYIHRYTFSLESKEDVLATFARLGETASDLREREYWDLLGRVIISSDVRGNQH